MFNFGKKNPEYDGNNNQAHISLDGSGKVSDDGRRLWRFSFRNGESEVGSEFDINGRSARVIESSDDGGYVELL